MFFFKKTYFEIKNKACEQISRYLFIEILSGCFFTTIWLNFGEQWEFIEGEMNFSCTIEFPEIIEIWLWGVNDNFFATTFSFLGSSESLKQEMEEGVAPNDNLFADEIFYFFVCLFV